MKKITIGFLVIGLFILSAPLIASAGGYYGTNYDTTSYNTSYNNRDYVSCYSASYYGCGDGHTTYNTYNNEYSAYKYIPVKTTYTSNSKSYRHNKKYRTRSNYPPYYNNYY